MRSSVVLTRRTHSGPPRRSSTVWWAHAQRPHVRTTTAPTARFMTATTKRDEESPVAAEGAAGDRADTATACAPALGRPVHPRVVEPGWPHRPGPRRYQAARPRVPAGRGHRAGLRLPGDGG